ncbi:MAG: GntR family transcriptional regulator [Anaerolineales bacterium]|nr:GntR family transcriptional regulator [Anaerolineales bacterium]
MFSKLQERSLRDLVAESIRNEIEAGRLQPGDRVIEADIASQMGISRAPVRDAIRLLEQEGFVVSVARKGTFVPRLTRKDIEEIYSLRAVLEGLGVELAIPRLTEVDQAELEKLVAEMIAAAEARDMPRLVESDLAFHQRLMCLSGHSRLLQDWLRMNTQLRLFFAMKGRLYENPRDVAASHDSVLEALRDRDIPRARHELTHHIIDAGHLVLANMEPSDEANSGRNGTNGLN